MANVQDIHSVYVQILIPISATKLYLQILTRRFHALQFEVVVNAEPSEYKQYGNNGTDNKENLRC